MGTENHIAPGGADGARDSAIDATNEKDRAAIRNACRRWPGRVKGITEARKFGWLEDLDRVRNVARKTMDDGGKFYPNGEGGVWETQLEAGKVIISAIKTEAAMEAMNQADDHKAAQIDADKDKPSAPTFNVGTLNVAALTQVANDPAAYAQFAKLADTVKPGDANGPDGQ